MTFKKIQNKKKTQREFTQQNQNEPSTYFDFGSHDDDNFTKNS